MPRKTWWEKPVEIDGQTRTPDDYLREVWAQLIDREISEILEAATGRNVGRGKVRDRRHKFSLIKTRAGYPHLIGYGTRQRYNKPPVVEADSVLVLADVHAPFHDAEWCSDVIGYARELKIKRVIIAGDLLDFHALSSFTKAMMTETEDGDETELSHELGEAIKICDVLLAAFETVDMVLGNHEERLSRATSVRMRATILKHLLGYRQQKRFRVYPYFYAIIKSSVGPWRITHPKNASVIPGRVPARLADKYKMHVVAAHGHDWCETTSVSGYYAAACGCCADPARLSYVALRDNLRPVVQTGAWLLNDCKPELLHPVYRRPGNITGGEGRERPEYPKWGWA